MDKILADAVAECDCQVLVDHLLTEVDTEEALEAHRRTVLRRCKRQRNELRAQAQDLIESVRLLEGIESRIVQKRILKQQEEDEEWIRSVCGPEYTGPKQEPIPEMKEEPP